MIHFVIMAQDKIKMHDFASHTTEKDENTELLKEKLLKVNSVLAAHQTALWEININTLECTFTQEYFESLGLYGAQNETYIEGWEKKTSNLLIYKRLCKI